MDSPPPTSLATTPAPVRILLVDDDATLLDILSLALEEAGYHVTTASNGAIAWSLLPATKPDVIVSDINMPVSDGFALCRKVRERNAELPFLLLTSRDNEIDEALGLDLGADDYVAKPFSTRVLLARIAALLRRQAARATRPPEPSSPAIRNGNVEIWPERLEVSYAKQPVQLTLTEFRLVECLLRRPGFVYSRQQLLDVLRSDGSVVADRIIDTYVRRLRRKFQSIDDSFQNIETVVGAGYRWKSDAR